MRAGDLRTRVTIQKKGGGVDDWGQPIPGSWTDVATVWSDFRHLSGSESIRADAETSIVKASIRIRWRSDLNAGMRVLVGEKVYSIGAVLPDLVGRQHVDLVAQLVE